MYRGSGDLHRDSRCGETDLLECGVREYRLEAAEELADARLLPILRSFL
jgi:hypothetical protein